MNIVNGICRNNVFDAFVRDRRLKDCFLKSKGFIKDILSKNGNHFNEVLMVHRNVSVFFFLILAQQI